MKYPPSAEVFAAVSGVGGFFASVNKEKVNYAERLYNL